jgi:DNA-binding MarR family transcriptional regulator
VHHLSKRVFNHLLSNQKIQFNPGQGRIFFVLWKEEGLPLRELAKRTSLSMSTLSTMLTRMQVEDLIIRKRDPQDKRIQRVFLTPSTHSMLHAYTEVSTQMNQIMFADFSSAELAIFREYLKRIHKNLTHKSLS